MRRWGASRGEGGQGGGAAGGGRGESSSEAEGGGDGGEGGGGEGGGGEGGGVGMDSCRRSWGRTAAAAEEEEPSDRIPVPLERLRLAAELTPPQLLSRARMAWSRASASAAGEDIGGGGEGGGGTGTHSCRLWSKGQQRMILRLMSCGCSCTSESSSLRLEARFVRIEGMITGVPPDIGTCIIFPGQMRSATSVMHPERRVAAPSSEPAATASPSGACRSWKARAGWSRDTSKP